MAIKIKKKDGRSDEEPELLEEDGSPVGEGAAGAAAQLSPDADPFLKASWDTASWVEENRNIVLGGIAAVFIAVVGGYMGLGFLENQKVQASSSLTPAFDAYNTLIEGSQEYEMLKSNPDLKLPDNTFKSNDERWQAVYDGSSKALSTHPSSEVSLAAELTKAAAAMELGKYDEAAKLYEEYRASSTDEAMKGVALQGLITVYASSDKWDEAVKALDELAGIQGFEDGARYQKARILEKAGKGEEAKKLYHEILDKDSEHPQKADIERRLANM